MQDQKVPPRRTEDGAGGWAGQARPGRGAKMSGAGARYSLHASVACVHANAPFAIRPALLTLESAHPAVCQGTLYAPVLQVPFPAMRYAENSKTAARRQGARGLNLRASVLGGISAELGPRVRLAISGGWLKN